jgi:hypothetical protein
MENEYLPVLERIAVALERIADGGNSLASAVPRESTADHARQTLLAKFEGMYITVDQGREALGMDGASAKAVGQAIAAAGFDRRRWSTGVRFAICEPGGHCSGSPVVLPDNLEAAVESARVARQKGKGNIDAKAILYTAYLMDGKQAKPSQVTPLHVAEVKRLYPDFGDAAPAE